MNKTVTRVLVQTWNALVIISIVYICKLIDLPKKSNSLSQYMIIYRFMHKINPKDVAYLGYDILNLINPCGLYEG